MLFLNIITAVTALIGASTAIPMRNTNTTLQTRQRGMNTTEINAALFGVAGLVALDALKEDSQQDRRNYFTRNVAVAMIAAFPDLNALVYGRSDSRLWVAGGPHYWIPFILDTGEGRGAGAFFELHLIDRATFQLVGDAGYPNWAWAGNLVYVQGVKFVQFYPRHEAVGGGRVGEKVVEKVGEKVGEKRGEWVA